MIDFFIVIIIFDV